MVTSVLPDDNELRAYSRTAAAIGFEPAALLEARLLRWLVEHAIPIFDYPAVSRYLTEEVQRQHGKIGSWWWRPLRAVDATEGWAWGSVQYDDGPAYARDIYSAKIWACRPYHRAVPLRVLARVEQIATTFPTLKFFVTEMGRWRGDAREGDPFICATQLDMGRIVFDAWDEPGFRG